MGRTGGRVRAYLLDDGQALTLIDTLYDDDGNVVLAEIEKIGKRPADLKQIILTHAHKSHVGGVAALKKASGAAVSVACLGDGHHRRPAKGDSGQ